MFLLRGPRPSLQGLGHAYHACACAQRVYHLPPVVCFAWKQSWMALRPLNEPLRLQVGRTRDFPKDVDSSLTGEFSFSFQYSSMLSRPGRVCSRVQHARRAAPRRGRGRQAGVCCQRDAKRDGRCAGSRQPRRRGQQETDEVVQGAGGSWGFAGEEP